MQTIKLSWQNTSLRSYPVAIRRTTLSGDLVIETQIIATELRDREYSDEVEQGYLYEYEVVSLYPNGMTARPTPAATASVDLQGSNPNYVTNLRADTGSGHGNPQETTYHAPMWQQM